MNARRGSSEPGRQSSVRGARLVVDQQGAVTEWSAEAQRLLGYSAEEVLGRNVTVLLSQKGPASTHVGVEVAGLAGVVAARHRNGHRIAVRAGVAPIPDDGGTVRWSVLFDPVDDRDEAALDAAVLRALWDSPLGVQVLDPELRVARLNPAGPGARGAVSSEDVGRFAREVAPGVVDDELERRLRSVVETGQPVTALELVGRPPADPDHEHVYEATLLPLKDPAGAVCGVLVASQDTSARHRIRARLDLLVKAGSRIGTTLDVMTTAEELAEACVPGLADIATVDVLDNVLQGEASQPGPVSAGALLRRAGFRAAEGLDASSAYRPGEVLPCYPPAFTTRLADLQPRLVRDLEADREWLGRDPRRADLIHSAGAHSLLVVPLTARGVVLGLAGFYRARTPDPFDEDDLALATELAARAAVCLDNARRYTKERNAARTLQRSLLPQSVPEQNAVDVAWRYEPSGGVGDWFDVIPLSGARVALVVGHLVGQGMQAAADMGRLRTAIATLAAQDLAPEELLAHLHDLVTGHVGECTGDPGVGSATARLVGASCVYAVYDPVSRRCTLARAGHPAPVIVRPGGLVEIPDVPAGPPLGAGHPPYEAVDVELPAGSTIALLTSSVARTAEAQTLPARLREVLGGPHRTLQDACNAVVHALHGREDDGIVLLLACTKSVGADQVGAWTLPNDPEVVATARTLAVRQLVDWGLLDLEFATELIVSELVTNAIRYGTGPIRLRLIRDLTLICEVSDGSSTAPHLRHAYETDEGGRGLFLVTQLARRWGTRYAARGKTIWAEQALPAAGVEPTETYPRPLVTA
ncbi:MULTISPECIES: SpoIIE family protein phosphatase [unclassified Streptomyces]|uniref:SpoIIE family protein phosphatase n=1 Tax=unclassified Streptomyces TaxID=2593676 RepID=UPI00325158E8